MISPDYCRCMARYNAWQNTSLISAADGLGDAARWQERGAFFGSIAATLNHLLWADALMLARLRGDERPHARITHSLTDPAEWDVFKEMRVSRDAEVMGWAEGLSAEGLIGRVGWYPPDGAARVEMDVALCAVQMFNHQTHHRGQVHAMLTAAGAVPGVTDLPAMPLETPE